MDKSCMTLGTLGLENFIFLIMGDAGFSPSTGSLSIQSSTP